MCKLDTRVIQMPNKGSGSGGCVIMVKLLWTLGIGEGSAFCDEPREEECWLFALLSPLSRELGEGHRKARSVRTFPASAGGPVF